MLKTVRGLSKNRHLYRNHRYRLPLNVDNLLDNYVKSKNSILAFILHLWSVNPAACKHQEFQKMKSILRNQIGLAFMGHVLLILTISIVTLSAMAFRAGESADVIEILVVKAKSIIYSARYFVAGLI